MKKWLWIGGVGLAACLAIGLSVYFYWPASLKEQLAVAQKKLKYVEKFRAENQKLLDKCKKDNDAMKAKVKNAGVNYAADLTDRQRREYLQILRSRESLKFTDERCDDGIAQIKDVVRKLEQAYLIRKSGSELKELESAVKKIDDLEVGEIPEIQDIDLQKLLDNEFDGVSKQPPGGGGTDVELSLLKSNPAQYDGKTITVTGEMSGSLVEGAARSRFIFRNDRTIIDVSKPVPGAIIFAVLQQDKSVIPAGLQSGKFYWVRLTANVHKGPKGHWFADVTNIEQLKR